MSTPSTQITQTAQRPLKGLPIQIIFGAMALALVVGVATWMRNPEVTELPKQPPAPALPEEVARRTGHRGHAA